MNHDPEMIDRIVREVLRRLSPPAARGNGPSSEENGAATKSDGTLRLHEQVVTLDKLDNRLGGVTHLEVPARAVVTPSVHDTLRQHEVILVRVSPAAAKSRPPRVRFPHEAVVVIGRTPPWQSLRDRSPTVVPDVEDAARQARRIASRRGHRVLITAPLPCVAAARTHHPPTTRVVAPGDLDELEPAIRATQANVLVLKDNSQVWQDVDIWGLWTSALE